MSRKEPIINFPCDILWALAHLPLVVKLSFSICNIFVDLAHQVLSLDDDIDDEEDRAIRQAIDRIRNDAERVSQEIDLIFIAQSLERVADHATNIAEDVILVVESLNLKHAEKLSS